MITVDQNLPLPIQLLVQQINHEFARLRPDNNVAITGGTINGTVIGGTTPAAGTFTTLNSTGGALNGTLGATTPASAVVTTLSITQGAIISGTYLPTLTNVANLDASTAYNAQYMRVGNVVAVSGKVDVDPTALLSTKLGISLPIASTLSAAEKCAGTANANSIASEVGAIEGDIVNNRAQLEWITVSVANHSMYYDFQYLVT